MVDWRAQQIFGNNVLALETEIVASSYDEKNRVCTYTIKRGDKRWTVEVPQAQLDAHTGPQHKQLKRNHLAAVLMQAMNGKPDPHAGTKDDPHRPTDWQDFEAVPQGEWYVNAADGEVQKKSREADAM